MNVHFAVSTDVFNIILFGIMAGIVLCICGCLWLVKQLMLVEMKTRAINLEIQRRTDLVTNQVEQ